MKRETNKTIASDLITFVHTIDENPDTDFIGKFTDKPKSDVYISRKDGLLHTGEMGACGLCDGKADGCEVCDDTGEVELTFDMGMTQWHSAREYAYFVPYCTWDKSEGWETIAGYCKQQWESMESLNEGQWNFIGIHAECNIPVLDTFQKVTSGGIWGIEDNCPEYVKEIESEQRAELVAILKEMGYKVTK